MQLKLIINKCLFRIKSGRQAFAKDFGRHDHTIE